MTTEELQDQLLQSAADFRKLGASINDEQMLLIRGKQLKHLCSQFEHLADIFARMAEE